MVNRVNGLKLVWKLKGVRLRINPCNDLVWSQRLLRELQRWTCGAKELSLYKDLIFDLEFGWRSSTRICQVLVTLLRSGDLLPKFGMKLLEVDGVVVGLSGREVSFRVDCEVGVVTLVSEERRNSRSCARSVVVRELCERE